MPFVLDWSLLIFQNLHHFLILYFYSFFQYARIIQKLGFNAKFKVRNLPFQIIFAEIVSLTIVDLCYFSFIQYFISCTLISS